MNELNESFVQDDDNQEAVISSEEECTCTCTCTKCFGITLFALILVGLVAQLFPIYAMFSAIIQLILFSYAYDWIMLFYSHISIATILLVCYISNFGFYLIWAFVLFFYVRTYFSVTKSQLSFMWDYLNESITTKQYFDDQMSKLKKLLRFQDLECPSSYGERRQIYKFILIEIFVLYIWFAIYIYLLLTEERGTITIFVLECSFFALLIAGQLIGLLLSTPEEQSKAKDVDLDKSTSKVENPKNDNKSLFESECAIFHICCLQSFCEPSQTENEAKIKKVLGFGMAFLQAVILFITFYNSNTKYFGKAARIGNLVRTIFFFWPVLQFNLIDLVWHWKRTWKKFDVCPAKCIWIALMVFYVIEIILYYVVLFCIAPHYFPTYVKRATYSQNNTKWYKVIDDYSEYSTSFCDSHSKYDTMQIDDLSMLTTLPRLYSFNDEGQCFIKPAKRNLFNTTMKYIFGQYYENQNIRIMCKKIYHGITLVITSDRQKYQAMSILGPNITRLPDQFKINNNNYFSTASFDNLTGDLYDLYQKYTTCLQNSTQKNTCQVFWDDFEYNYWSTMYTDAYANISGFERYQITIDEDMVIQPQFITSNGEYMSGVHYVVGGGMENTVDFGLYLEILIRAYLPKLFTNFLPLYDGVHSILKNRFNMIDWQNRILINPGRSIPQQMTDLTTLYSQLNFSHKAIYTVGTSISGAVQKGVSYFTDIPGISINSGPADNLGYFTMDKNFKTEKSEATHNVNNIYISGNFLMGIDSNYKTNAMLPKRYGFLKVPNPYETACLTSVTCSSTMKYFPFCEQVLADNIEKGQEELFEDIHAYYDFY